MRTILTPRQLAEAIGVSESSVKRWVDDGSIAATRTAGGHRRIPLPEAARYIRKSGAPVVRPDLLGLHDLEGIGESEVGLEGAGIRLFEYLRAGAAAEARGLVLSHYLEGRSVAEIVDGPLAEAMKKVGELWVSSSSGIFWEHRATQIAIEALDRLRLLLGPREGAPAAVGGAPAGDRYILPSLAAAAVLEGEGLEATNLGPETPIDTLALAAEDLDARLVWLSVSFAADVEKLRRSLEALIPKLAGRNAILVVGGAQFSKLGLSRGDSVYVGRSMAELEALAQGLRLSRSTPRRAERAES